jgi:pimeloyl-ACP methyl ester carboxylesterase
VLRTTNRLEIGAAAAAALAALSGCDAPATDTGGAPAAEPPRRVSVPNDATPARVDIGGYSLAVRCSGRGRPAVVLEAGFGLASGRWRKTQRVVQRTHKVCSYDRAGIGRSDERPPSARGATVEGELHALLRAIGLPAPYVLAGHSAGGAHAADFARAYPKEVVGLVLVDAVSPGPLRRELRAAPLVVLEQGRDRGWSDAQAASARLSSNSIHIVALESGHHIQASQPGLVAAAIRAVARAGRAGRLPPCERVAAPFAADCVRDAVP